MENNIERIFGKDIDNTNKSEYLDTLFSKYLIPKLGMFREVKEDLFHKYRRSGTVNKARWFDKHNNAFALRCFNQGPWFFVVNPSNAREYGIEHDDDIKYYEIPQFGQVVDQMVLTERELFG